MNSILKVSYSAIFICLLPITMATGQDKKSEQKIKIIANDGSGTKVLIDTLIKDGEMKDSLTLKNGKVVYFKNGSEDIDIENSGGKDHVFITVSDDRKRGKKRVKEITIISSDSIAGKEEKEDNEGDNEVLYGNSGGHRMKDSLRHRYITSSSQSDGDKVSEIYIKEDDGPEKEMTESFDVYVSPDNEKTDSEKTKYVISKNGMVVSVEGSDYEEVKELVKIIENQLDAKKSDHDKASKDKGIVKEGKKK